MCNVVQKAKCLTKRVICGYAFVDIVRNGSSNSYEEHADSKNRNKQ